MTFRGFSQSLFLVKNWSCQLEDFKCLEKEFICRNEKTTTTKYSVQFPKLHKYFLRFYQRFVSSILNMDFILSHLTIDCRCVAFFDPKKVHVKVKMDLFPNCMLQLQTFSVLPKMARSAQRVENSHSFFNVFYTCYKSLMSTILSNCTLLEKEKSHRSRSQKLL